MFMVTSLREDAGKSDFAVLDYVHWAPRRQLPRSAFNKPPQCAASPLAGASPSTPSHCSNCHLGKLTD